MGDRQECIERLMPRGQATVLFADHVGDALTSVEQAFEALSPSLPMVMMVWPQPPRIDLMIESTVLEFARAACSAWPDWHTEEDRRARVFPAAAKRKANYGNWRVAAESLASAGDLPLPAGFSHADHVRYLNKVLGDSILVVMAVEKFERSSAGNDPHLDGLCRAAAWLSERSRSRVGVLIERSLQGRSELASVDFGSLEWSDLTQPEPWAWNRQWTTTFCSHIPGLPTEETLESRSEVCSHDISDVTKGSAADAPRENKLRFWPILDRPHPDSPGEQRLSEALATDALLAELFRFNQVVETAWQRRYIVDLLNAKDRLIVEVDGYHCHRGQRAFNADRLRDFHLITSGYLVIRIPHDEVMHDVRAALEKIRSLVRFRRQGKINREAM